MKHSGVNACLLLFLIFSLLIPANFKSVCQNCIHGMCSEDNTCKDGCKVGFTGKRCSYECETNCKNSKCEVDDTGAIACLSCDDGYCGKKCLYHCKAHCITCNQKDCKCRTNSHGNVTDFPECRPNCQKCEEDGTCSFCRRKYFGNECEFTCTQCVVAESLELFTTKTDCKKCSPIEVSKIMTSLHVITAICVLVTILILLVILCGVKFYRRNKNRPSRQDRGDVEEIMMINRPNGENNDLHAGEQPPGEHDPLHEEERPVGTGT